MTSIMSQEPAPIEAQGTASCPKSYKKPLGLFSDGWLVTVLLMQNESIQVHSSILTKSSKIPRDALTGDEKQKKTTTVDLTQLRYGIALPYLDWLHGTSLLESHAKQGFHACLAYFALDYLELAEAMEDNQFYNECVDAFILYLKTDRFPHILVKFHLNAKCMPWYEWLSEDSPVLQLLVDFSVHHADLSWFEDEERVPEEFWWPFVMALREKKVLKTTDPVKAQIKPWIDNPCKYHRHDEDSLENDSEAWKSYRSGYWLSRSALIRE